MKISPLCTAALALLLLAPSAFSQATRTWVSGVGDDANPGSRTAPCLTFAGALARVAGGGEIDNLDTGDYAPVTLAESITLDGGPGIAGILVSGSPAIIISSGTGVNEVTLRNLDLDGDLGGGTAGIQVTGQVILHIENCRIFNFAGHGIDFEPAAGSALFIKNSYIYGNGGDGIYLKPGAASTVSIVNSHIDDNAVGVHGDDHTVTTVQGGGATGNAGAGFETTVGATMTINNSDSSLNGAGISSAGTVVITGVTVTNNSGEGLARATGGHIESFHNNPIGDNDSKKEGVPTSYLPLR